MKKILTSPPTPTQKRLKPTAERAGATSSTNSAVSMPPKQSKQEDSSSSRDLKFMEATFRVVGYQARDEQENEEVKHVKEDGSVFHPDTRKTLSKGKLDLVKFIENNYAVPKDFETSTKFGPHSGLCFEDRLISCYEWQQLSPKDKFRKTHESDNAWKLCWKCEEKGTHLAREGCPNEA